MMQSQQQQPRLVRQKRPDGRIVYVVGFTGAGKTTWTRQEVARESSLLVWDAKEEWGPSFNCKVITTPQQLAQLVMPSSPVMRISYRVPVTRDNFDVFCKLAWIYCRSRMGHVVVEELADVTTPSKAPTSWGEIVRKSRGYGTTVYALTQRPQEVDKTVQGNAALFHCGMMSDKHDARYVAQRLLNIDTAQVEALKPLQFIERDVRAMTIRTGKVNPKLRK